MADFHVLARLADDSLSSVASLGVCEDASEALRRFNEGLAKTHRLGLFRLLAAEEAGQSDYCLLEDRPGSPVLTRLARMSDPVADASLLTRMRAAAASDGDGDA
ncbi:MAG: hypothetical protein AB1592_15555 [Pseudomonadota bacterium]